MSNFNDPEFVQIRNRFLIALLFGIIVAIPLLIFVFKSYGNKDGELLKYVKDDKTVIVMLTSEDCSKCNSFENVLIKNNVGYFKLNIDTNDDYSDVLKNIEMNKSDVITPSLLYVVDGKLYSSLSFVKDEESISKFLENYNLINTK